MAAFDNITPVSAQGTVFDSIAPAQPPDTGTVFNSVKPTTRKRSPIVSALQSIFDSPIDQMSDTSAALKYLDQHPQEANQPLPPGRGSWQNLIDKARLSQGAPENVSVGEALQTPLMAMLPLAAGVSPGILAAGAGAVFAKHLATDPISNLIPPGVGKDLFDLANVGTDFAVGGLIDSKLSPKTLAQQLKASTDAQKAASFTDWKDHATELLGKYGDPAALKTELQRISDEHNLDLSTYDIQNASSRIKNLWSTQVASANSVKLGAYKLPTPEWLIVGGKKPFANLDNLSPEVTPTPATTISEPAPAKNPFGTDMNAEYQKAMALPRGEVKPTDYFSKGMVETAGNGESAKPLKAPNTAKAMSYAPLLQSALANVPAAQQPDGQPLNVANLNDGHRESLFKEIEYKLGVGGNDQSVVEHLTKELQPDNPTVWVVSHHQGREDAADSPLWDAQKLQHMTIAEYAFNQKQLNLQRVQAGLPEVDLAKELSVKRTTYRGQKAGIPEAVRQAILREYKKADPTKLPPTGTVFDSVTPVTPTVDQAAEAAGQQATVNLQDLNAVEPAMSGPSSQSQPVAPQQPNGVPTATNNTSLTSTTAPTVFDNVTPAIPNPAPVEVHEEMRKIEYQAVDHYVDRSFTRADIGKQALELAKKLGRKPTSEELASAMGTTVKDLEDVLLNRKVQADHLREDGDKGFTSDDWNSVTITDNESPIELTAVNDVLGDWVESLKITSLESAVEEEAGQETRTMRSQDAKSMFKKKMGYEIGSKEHAQRADQFTPSEVRKAKRDAEAEKRRLAGLAKMKQALALHKPYLMDRYLGELANVIGKLSGSSKKIATDLTVSLNKASTPEQIMAVSQELQRHIYQGIKKSGPMQVGEGGVKGGVRITLNDRFMANETSAGPIVIEPGSYVLQPGPGQTVLIDYLGGITLEAVELAKMVANENIGVDATDFYRERGHSDHDAWLYKMLSPLDEGGPSVGLSIRGISGKRAIESFDGQERQSPISVVLRTMRRSPEISNFFDYGLTEEDIKAESQKKDLFKIPDKAKEEVFSAYQFEAAVQKISQQELSPIFYDVLEHIRAQLKAQPKPKGVKVDKKKQEQAALNLYSKLMASASAQVLVLSGDSQNWGWSGHASGPHQPGAKNPSDEADAYVKRVQYFYNEFNIPPQDQQTDAQLRAGRTPVFWDLLVHPNVMSSDRLQRAILFYKAQIEQPLLEEEMKHGIYQHNDIWKMVREGYQKKAFTAMGEQASGTSDSPGSYGTGSVQRPATAFRTYEEFLYRAPQERWIAVDDFFNNGHQYIIEALRGVKQSQLLRELSIMKRPMSTVEFSTPALAELWKNHPLDITLRQVEYQTSPAIDLMAKHFTTLGHEIQPMGVLQELDYVEGNKSDGLDKWYRGSFEPPFIYKQLNETIKMIYGKRVSFESLNGLAKALMYMRHFLTINPVDNYGPWVGMAMMERPVWQVVPYYAYSIGVRLPMAIAEGAFKTGPQIFQGNYHHGKTGAKYPWMRLFLEEGSTASSGFSSFLANVIDKADRGIFPERQGRFNNWNDYVLSVGGIGTAIFERMMGDDIYYAMERIAEDKLAKGATHQDAARYAVNYMNTAAWSLNRSAFNDEGFILQLLTISRNFAVVPFRIMSILNYNVPVTGNLAKKAGYYNLKTGSGKWSNPFTGADIPEKMMGGGDGLSAKYWKNLGMMLFWTYFTYTMLQLAMSFMDDDKVDEHGEIGANLGMAAKKRWMWNNPGHYKMMIRSTNFDVNGKRAYWDYGMTKILNNLFDISSTVVDPLLQTVTGDKSIDTGKGVVAFAQSKRGIIFTYEDILNNMNTSGPNKGKEVWDPFAPESEQWDNVGRIMAKAGGSVVPINTPGLIPGTHRQTVPLQDKAADAFMVGSNFFGVNQHAGPPEGSGMTASNAQLLEDRVNSFKFKQQEEAGKEGNMTDAELRQAVMDGKVTGQALQDRMLKKMNPVMFFKTKNQKALFESSAGKTQD